GGVDRIPGALMLALDSRDEMTDDDAPATAAVSEPAVERRPRSRARSVGTFFRDVLIILLAAVLISWLIKTFLIRSFYIPSESMEPTLFINDRIIVNQLVPDLSPIEH